MKIISKFAVGGLAAPTIDAFTVAEFLPLSPETKATPKQEDFKKDMYSELIDKVKGNRIASDINPYLIAMYQKIQRGWMPRNDYDKTEYNYIRQNKEKYPHLAGYFGFALSYGGKWFGGWCRDRRNRALRHSQTASGNRRRH